MTTTNFKMNYDMLVYAALVLFVLIVLIALLTLARNGKHIDSENRRLRLASVMFTAIIMLFVFCASLYYTAPDGYAGREIFDKGLIVIATLAGSIIGYCFGASPNGRQEAQVCEQRNAPRPPVQAEPIKKAG